MVVFTTHHLPYARGQREDSIIGKKMKEVVKAKKKNNINRNESAPNAQSNVDSKK